MNSKGSRRRSGLRSIALLILSLALGYWFVVGRHSAARIDAGSTLWVELAGKYVEAPGPSILDRLMGGQGQSFRSKLHALERAQRDSRIDSVILSIRGLSIGWGKADELRAAISRLRKSGRKVIALLELEGFSINREYYIATAADEIQVVPGSVLPMVGLAAQYLYLGGLWKNLGIEVEATRAGKYKSAVEAIAGRKMSDAAREMSNSLLDGAEGRFVAAVAEGRGLTPEEVRKIIDRGLVNPEDLMAAGMIDGIRHLDQIPEAKARLVKGSDYRKVSDQELGFDPKVKLALIYGSGSVVTGRAGRTLGGSPVFASENVRQALLDAAADPAIQGILLRIDSPGGSPLASEVMWNAVSRVRREGTPVVVSVSDVAASGAYYVASAADAIVIPPGALTGSIGVFALRATFDDLFEKLDIGVETLTRGPYSDFGLSAHRLSPQARELMERVTQGIYRQFVARVAEGRGLSEESVDALGQGRVWSGEQALEIGLVDHLGGMQEAVKVMLRILGLDDESDVSMTLYPAPPNLADQLRQWFQTRGAQLLTPGASALAAIDKIVPLPAGLEMLRSGWGGGSLDRPLLISPVWVRIR